MTILFSFIHEDWCKQSRSLSWSFSPVHPIKRWLSGFPRTLNISAPLYMTQQTPGCFHWSKFTRWTQRILVQTQKSLPTPLSCKKTINSWSIQHRWGGRASHLRVPHLTSLHSGPLSLVPLSGSASSTVPMPQSLLSQDIKYVQDHAAHGLWVVGSSSQYPSPQVSYTQWGNKTVSQHIYLPGSCNMDCTRKSEDISHVVVKTIFKCIGSPLHSSVDVWLPLPVQVYREAWGSSGTFRFFPTSLKLHQAVKTIHSWSRHTERGTDPAILGSLI